MAGPMTRLIDRIVSRLSRRAAKVEDARLMDLAQRITPTRAELREMRAERDRVAPAAERAERPE